MSDANETAAGPTHEQSVHEIQGSFPSDAKLQDGLSALHLAGYDRADLSLPEEQPVGVVETPNESAAGPTDDEDTRQLRTMGTSMAGYAGAVAVAGATLATGGAAGLAVAAAAAVGVGTATVANSAGRAASDAQSADRDRRGAEGTLKLAVRTRTADQAAQVTKLLQDAGATEIRPVTRANEALTAGYNAASWTGG